MSSRLVLPLAVLALGLAAAGGFFAAAAVLSEGGGQAGTGPQPVLQEAEGGIRVWPLPSIGWGFAGLVLAEEPDGGGVRIQDVLSGSPADDAGLVEGDVIVAVDGQPIDSVAAVQTAIVQKRPGDEMTISLRRDGGEEDVTITLGAVPGLLRQPLRSPYDVEVPSSQWVRPYLGATLADITAEIRDELDLPGGDGVVVVDVVKGGPAYEGGLRRGDVILMVGPRLVKTAGEAVDAVLDYEPGEVLPMIIRRDFRELSVQVELGAWPRLALPWDVEPGRLPLEGGLRALLQDLDLDLGLELDLSDPEELIDRFVRADISVLDGQGQTVELHLTPGFLLEVSDQEVRLVPCEYCSVSYSFSVTEETRVFRGFALADVDDLQSGDRAVVLTRGDSDEALVIFSPRAAGDTALRPFPVPLSPELLLPSPDAR